MNDNMKQHFRYTKTQKLLFAGGLLLLLSFVIGSCKKEDNKNSGEVQLLSFGPTGAKNGDTLRFIGNNLDKVTSIEFTGGAAAVVAQTDFKLQTKELILVIVPLAAEKGYVTLKTTQGDIVSKTVLNLNVLAEVTALTAKARPGENITISGSYLNWVKRVTFARDKVVENFVSQSFSEIVVQVPEDAESGTLILFYGGTDSADLETSEVLEVALPQATGLSPNPILHQTDLTITGTDLDLAKQVLFPGVSTPVTSFVSQSANQLVVNVPGATVKGKITLVAASGLTTESTDELDLVLPVINTVTPNPVDPQADLTITGTHLDLVTAVNLENVSPVTSFVSQSPTQIVVTVPTGVTRGKVKLSVLNSSLVVESADVLEITGTAPPPTIAFPIYDDAVTSNWTSTGGWKGNGWGGTSDINNTSPVRDGTKSWKIDYVGGWGAPLQLGGANVTIAPYTTFKISIYGAPGSGGKNVNIGINGQDAYTITVVEGVWTDYAIPISSLTGSANLTDIIVKEYNGSGGFTIYVDALGLN